MARAAVLAVLAVLGLAVGGVACHGADRARGGGAAAPGAGSVAAGDACRLDADCATGFCDRDRCAAPSAEHGYGRSCTAGPSPAADADAAKLHVCGAYVCRDARCRSCADDAECRAELGAPRCVPLEGRPGRRCGAGPD